MTEIDYKSLKAPLSEVTAQNPTQVYLIYGEEMLVKEAFASVLKVLLPEADRSLNFELLDGGDTDMGEVVERINTYSMVAGNKVVAITDARLFMSGQHRSGLLKKAAGAVEADDLKTGARHLAAAMGIAGLTLPDLSGPNRIESLKRLGVDPAEAGWLDRLVDDCRQKPFRIPEDKDADEVLLASLEKGLPAGNHLIVTTEQVDRRRRLYTVIKELGTAIDCSVPKGERRADRQVQKSVMRRQMTRILDKAGKTIEPRALQRLSEMTGFDLRTAAGGLQKLIDYTGNRREIREEDVVFVLRRSKKDPIFEFTNALTDRNLDDALFYLDSLLSGGVLEHPLQLLGASANQLRKLILLKEFAESADGRQWHPQMPFKTFTSRVLPAMQQKDKRLLERLRRWQGQTVPDVPKENPETPEQKTSRKKTGKERIRTDLQMVVNPRNAYPIYRLLEKSANFSMQELTDGLRRVARCDLRIKTGMGDPRLILEKAVIAICTRAEEGGGPGRMPSPR